MRIGMMSPWNVACGVSVHAELIGREWVKNGHKLTVFAPIEKETQPRTGDDEPFVRRCYTMDREFVKGVLKTLWLDPQPFLETDYEVFVVQNLELMPMAQLLDLWPTIKSKAVTILVIHEGYLPPYPEFYHFNWDAIVCFDDRYHKEFSKKFPAKKLHIIPYPCHPVKLGDKNIARQKLLLPLDKKIVFSYGIQIQQHFPVLSILEQLSQEYPVLYLVLAAEGKTELLEKVQARYDFLEVRYEAKTIDELYTYLHASDVLLLYKQSPNIVVASTVYLCLGSGCPIVISEGRYTETLNGEVFKYSDFDELRAILERIFQGGQADKTAIQSFLQKHSASRIAQQFIELALSLQGSQTEDALLEPSK